MDTHRPTTAERVTQSPLGKYVFVTLIVALLAIAVTHLYVLRGVTTLYWGLPLWLWIQLIVIAIMLGIAWLAVAIYANVTRGDP